MRFNASCEDAGILCQKKDNELPRCGLRELQEQTVAPMQQVPPQGHGQTSLWVVKLTKSYGCRYCRQVLCETVRTAKLTPIAAQLQELEGRVDQHTIPKEVGQYWEHQSTFLSWRGICHFLFFLQGGEAGRPFLLTLLNPSSCSGISKYSLARRSPCSSSVAEALGIHGLFLSRFASSSGSTRGESYFEGAYGFSCA